MKTEELKIVGMSCGHCVMSVKRELSKLNSVQVDEVQIGKAVIRYDEKSVTAADIARAIDEAGFQLA